MGRILLQRLATGATGVKQARYRQGPLGQRGTRTRMRSIHCVSSVPIRRSLALAVQCETWHGVMPLSTSACIAMNSAEGFAL